MFYKLAKKNYKVKKMTIPLNFNKTPSIGFAANYKVLIVDDCAKMRQIHKKIVETVANFAFPEDTFEILQSNAVNHAKKIIQNPKTKPHIYLGDGHINNIYVECPDGPNLAKFAEENGVLKKAIAVISGDRYDAKNITLKYGYEFIEKYRDGKIVDFFIKVVDNLKKIGQ